MEIDNLWVSATGPAAAEALVQRLTQALTGQFARATFAYVEGVPLLRLTRAGEPLRVMDVLRVARTLQQVAQCPVHFHRLERLEVAFLVYHACLHEGPFTHTQLSERGVPLSDWLPRPLRDGPSGQLPEAPPG